MDRKALIAAAGLVGIVCGFLSTHVLMIGWANLLVWALAGIALGCFARSGNEVVLVGAVFGICLTISFLFSGFQGTSDKLLEFSFLSLALCIPGVLGGVVSVFIGQWARSLY